MYRRFADFATSVADHRQPSENRETDIFGTPICSKILETQSDDIFCGYHAPAPREWAARPYHFHYSATKWFRPSSFSGYRRRTRVHPQSPCIFPKQTTSHIPVNFRHIDAQPSHGSASFTRYSTQMGVQSLEWRRCFSTF
jgi:hypothetical protein